MKMQYRIILTIVVVLGLSLTQNLSAKYKLDELKIDLQFEASIDVSSIICHGAKTTNSALRIPSMDLDNPDYKTASMLAFGEALLSSGIYGMWFLITIVTGGFGIVLLPGTAILASLIGSPWHRYYLGTDDNSFKIGALYCITSNGFGLLLIADAIALMTAEDNDQTYFNNSKFIMWIDEI